MFIFLFCSFISFLFCSFCCSYSLVCSVWMCRFFEGYANGYKLRTIALVCVNHRCYDFSIKIAQLCCIAVWFIINNMESWWKGVNVRKIQWKLRRIRWKSSDYNSNLNLFTFSENAYYCIQCFVYLIETNAFLKQNSTANGITEMQTIRFICPDFHLIPLWKILSVQLLIRNFE